MHSNLVRGLLWMTFRQGGSMGVWEGWGAHRGTQRTTEVTAGRHYRGTWSAVVQVQADPLSSLSQICWMKGCWGGVNPKVACCLSAWPNYIPHCIIIDYSPSYAFVLREPNGRQMLQVKSAKTAHRFVFMSHPPTSVASLNPTFWKQLWSFQNDKLVTCCWFTQKHQERISAVLHCAAALPLLDYSPLRRKHQRHTPVGCAAAHACWWDPHSSCSSQNKGLHCALGDMTLLDFIAASACVHSSELHNMDGEEAPSGEDINHYCTTEGESLAARVKVKPECHWNTITPECAEVISRVRFRNTMHSLQRNDADLVILKAKA